MGKHIISSVLAAAGMFGLSYLWHGVFLNDLDRLSYSPLVFLALATLVYLIIGAVLNWVLHQVDLSKRGILKGFAIGSIVGFVIYLIAFTLGVSFQATGIEHIAVDFVWQMFEEGVGGAVIAFAILLAKRKAEFFEEA